MARKPWYLHRKISRRETRRYVNAYRLSTENIDIILGNPCEHYTDYARPTPAFGFFAGAMKIPSRGPALYVMSPQHIPGARSAIIRTQFKQQISKNPITPAFLPFKSSSKKVNYTAP